MVLLGDFGITVNNGAKNMGGTPMYKPPEQIEEHQPQTSYTDRYAIGILVIELASGEFEEDEINNKTIQWAKRSENINFWRQKYPLSKAVSQQQFQRPPAETFRAGLMDGMFKDVEGATKQQSGTPSGQAVPPHMYMSF